jgi:hypothetical protein
VLQTWGEGPRGVHTKPLYKTITRSGRLSVEILSQLCNEGVNERNFSSLVEEWNSRTKSSTEHHSKIFILRNLKFSNVSSSRICKSWTSIGENWTYVRSVKSDF